MSNILSFLYKSGVKHFAVSVQNRGQTFCRFCHHLYYILNNQDFAHIEQTARRQASGRLGVYLRERSGSAFEDLRAFFVLLYIQRKIEGITEPRSYEIDFLISRHDKICPIEVKSSGYKAHKSLDEFQKKYSSRILQRYLIYTKDLRKEEDIICLPVYMTGLL